MKKSKGASVPKLAGDVTPSKRHSVASRVTPGGTLEPRVFLLDRKVPGKGFIGAREEDPSTYFPVHAPKMVHRGPMEM